MLNSQGKLRGEGPPKRMRIVWIDCWVEPGDGGDGDVNGGDDAL